MGLVALSTSPASAVIVLGNQGRNLSAPTGDLAGSGWDLEGDFGGFLGTPIAPDLFVTAAHFGNAAGSLVTLDGVAHPVTHTTYLAGTDLVVRQVSVPFTQYASIYDSGRDGSLTVGDKLIDFGRGTARGDAIAGHGWLWGVSDSARSWGTNTFAGLYAVSQADRDAGFNYAVGTQFVTANFENNGDPDECTLSNGDSGGGLFVYKNGSWELVGVNYGVELFSTSPDGPDAGAAVYDARGFYENNGSGYAQIDPALPQAVGQQWIASMVPAMLARMAEPIPEPAAACSVVSAVIFVGLVRRTKHNSQPSRP